ncbi:hypothetical protein [Roseomonas xinghualingensis]|uniref:hypothetical protein n=1 Tax=Roseomonas xinghualingensis TaxID=2986475 RepID=UPI0021F15E41|nr:hypothetical protein [Roseomonas sp. SXEYE001]
MPAPAVQAPVELPSPAETPVRSPEPVVEAVTPELPREEPAAESVPQNGAPRDNAAKAEAPVAPKWQAPAHLVPQLPPLGTAPITPRQHAALQSVGFDASGWTELQARIVLAARDYFEVLFAERGKPPGRYKEVRLACIKELLADDRFYDELPAWSAREMRRPSGEKKELGPEGLYTAAVLIWKKASKGIKPRA